MAGPSSSAAAALKTFELENNIEETDMVYKYDNATNQKNLSGKGWTKDPRWFKHVRISALALVKITMHARSGGDLEVMGLMVGKIDPDDPRGPTMIVLDCFALPVEGTETRVNAQADAYEYMVEFLSTAKEAGRLENVLGWYHSHPGYGCWLSGIDVSTQMLNQQYQEPWLAIVIDPHKTAATGKVEIGAFRTYPQGYKPPEGEDSEFESVPLSKIEDFGVHKNQYYQLEVSYFKSACDTALLSGAPPSLHSTRISTQGGRAKRASQERARRHPPAALHADPARANTAHFFPSRPLLPHCHACLPAVNMSTGLPAGPECMPRARSHLEQVLDRDAFGLAAAVQRALHLRPDEGHRRQAGERRGGAVTLWARRRRGRRRRLLPAGRGALQEGRFAAQENRARRVQADTGASAGGDDAGDEEHPLQQREQRQRRQRHGHRLSVLRRDGRRACKAPVPAVDGSAPHTAAPHP